MLPLRHLWAWWPCQRPIRAAERGRSWNASPRRDGSVVLVGRVAVPKTGQKPPSPRRDATEVPVGRVAVPKTGQKTPFATQDATGVLVGRVAVPKQIVRRIIMVEVKVLVGYAPWQMVSGGIGSRKGKGPTKWEGPPGTICHGAIKNQLFLRRRHWLQKRGAHEVGRPSRHHLSRSNHGPAISPA